MSASGARAAEPGAAVLELRGVEKRYPVRTGLGRRARELRAVDGVDLAIAPGETLGLVGESGSGKSTLARLAMGTVAPTAGTVWLRGEPVTGAGASRMRTLRRHAQMVFQDPYSSFDPLASIGNSVAEPLATHLSLTARERAERVRELFGLVGLSGEHAGRRPRELSGGQLQRAAVARALAVEPALLVLDEPVSALDVSTQAQLINLLEDLRAELGTAYLFIAHDLTVVRHISHRTAVMYLGRIVESGPADELHERPRHPYTASLLSAIPLANPRLQRARRRMALTGDAPSPIDVPSGCRFHTRCPHVMSVCHEIDPPELRVGDVVTFCHLHTSGPTLAGAPLGSPVALGKRSPSSGGVATPGA